MKTEPLVTVATITAAAVALIAVLTNFGLDLTEGQEASLLGVVAVIAPLVVAALARPKVTPVGSGNPTTPLA